MTSLNPLSCKQLKHTHTHKPLSYSPEFIWVFESDQKLPRQIVSLSPMAKAVSNNLLWSENDSLREKEREWGRRRHIRSGESYLFFVSEQKWSEWVERVRGREINEWREIQEQRKWWKRRARKQQRVKATVSGLLTGEPEGRHDGLIQVKPLSLPLPTLIPALPPPSHLSPAGDCRCGIAYRAGETGLHQKAPQLFAITQ